MEIDIQEVLAIFTEETAEGLQAMEEAVVALEARPRDRQAVDTVFRVTHTLKGNAGSLGFPAVADFAHVLEDLLDRIRKGRLEVTPPLVSLLLQAVDALKEMVPEAVAGAAQLRPTHLELLARLRAGQAERAAAAGPAPAAPAEPEHDTTLRVGLDKLDRLLNLTGEIAIAQGRLQTALLPLAGLAGGAVEAHQEAARLFADLQELVMKARMVPLGPTFHRHVRSVRDLAVSHGKLARLVIEGEDVEVDTSVVEHIRDPLTHMIRNAIDHGLEPPEVRQGLGKDPCGQLTLRARHDAGSLLIELQDDGAGLDRERILARARAQGLVPEGAQPGDQELYRLIFEPGFSTADEVSDLSGRGVGLDVVRRNVEALRGSVGLESRPGLGTTLSLRLPLTLAIIEGLNVRLGPDTFVLPLDAVIECLELPRERSESGERGVLSLRGESLPYLRLRGRFALGGAPPEREQVVVVRHVEGRAGLVVDAVLGESQTVIKPLGRLFQGLPGISGASILGDGRVALILDAARLLASALAGDRGAA